MITVKCPYCSQENTLEERDIELDDGALNELGCEHCGKIFRSYTQMAVSLSDGIRVDCLNGGNHRWRSQGESPHLVGKEYFLCRVCGEGKYMDIEVEK